MKPTYWEYVGSASTGFYTQNGGKNLVTGMNNNCLMIGNNANGTGTYFVVMHEIAHTQQKVGLASAMAIVLLVIIFIATLIQRLLFKYVFTDGEAPVNSKSKRLADKASKF